MAQFFQLPESKIKSILDSVNDITLPAWDKAMIEGAAHTLKAGADSVCVFVVIANDGAVFIDLEVAHFLYS